MAEPVVYSFRSPYRCDACDSLRTRQRKKKGPVQWRICLDCGARIKQVGIPA